MVCFIRSVVVSMKHDMVSLACLRHGEGMVAHDERLKPGALAARSSVSIRAAGCEMPTHGVPVLVSIQAAEAAGVSARKEALQVACTWNCGRPGAQCLFAQRDARCQRMEYLCLSPVMQKRQQASQRGKKPCR